MKYKPHDLKRYTFFLLLLFHPISNAVYTISELGLRGSQLGERICEMLKFLGQLVFDRSELRDRKGGDIDCWVFSYGRKQDRVRDRHTGLSLCW